MATKTNESASKWGVKPGNSVSEPEIVGYYSVDRDRNYRPDSSQLLYYIPPREKTVHLDLNQGIESAVRRTELYDEERIDHLLEWIKLNHAKIDGSEFDSWIKPNFVTSCGQLSQLLSTKFATGTGWIMHAAKWKGSIYLCNDKRNEYVPAYDNMEKFSSWGFKFEQFILSDAPDKDPDTSKPVIEPEEFRCIYQRRFGNHTLLYSAEMDGVISDEPLTDPLPIERLKFVELKTKINIDQLQHIEKVQRNFRRFRLLKWWCVCFLTNIEMVLCGLRDNNGIVDELRSYSISDIISMGQGYWDPNSCIDYCTVLLTQISKLVVNDCQTTIYKLEKKPYHQNLYVTEVSPSSEFSFLPSSFLEATN